MRNDQNNEQVIELAEIKPTMPVPIGIDETAQKLAAIESEHPTGRPVVADASQVPALSVSDEMPSPADVVAVTPTEKHKKPMFKSKKRALLVVALASVLVVSGGALALALLYQTPVPEAQAAVAPAPAPIAKLGLAVTVADGTVTYKRAANSEWQPLTTDTQIGEGAQIKTASESRAVLAFDDGSALRLDADSTVQIVSLATNDIEITQIAGMAYSRVVPSERNYTVTVDGVGYKALGTAFSTIKTSTETGVRVFQSQVRVAGVTDSVAEGKQFFKNSSNVALKGKVTDIDVDTMANDSFVKWNIEQDEKAATFKDKLGLLVKVKERLVQKDKDAEAEKQRQAAELAEKAKQAAEQKQLESTVNKDKDKATAKITPGTLKLTVNAQGKATWSFSGVAPYGYKLVASKSPNPTFPVSTATYYGDSAATTGEVPANDGGGSYYVRVCVYTNGTEEVPCTNYSNEVKYTKTK